MAVRRRYHWFAPAYDLLSGEWPVYRAGRAVGVRALALRPGDRVLDVGCGTGLTLPSLCRAVGESGRVFGVDASAAMLAQARQRVSRHGCGAVDLIHADAAAIHPGVLGPGTAGGDVDAVIFVYALSVMADWRPAWHAALATARPGARVVVVDMALPQGAARVFSPLARLACAAGGADIRAAPWAAVEELGADVRSWSLRGGHIEVRSAVVPG